MKEGEGFARRVTQETLSRFAALLRRGNEPSAEDQGEGAAQSIEEAIGPSRQLDPSLAEAVAQFQGVAVQVTLPFSRARRRPRAPRTRESQIPLPTSRTQRRTVTRSGPLVWRKRRLPASDVQRQKVNPTGGLRLTQH